MLETLNGSGSTNYFQQFKLLFQYNIRLFHTQLSSVVYCAPIACYAFSILTVIEYFRHLQKAGHGFVEGHFERQSSFYWSLFKLLICIYLAESFADRNDRLGYSYRHMPL